MKHALLPLLALVVASCATQNSYQAPMWGVWGGDHVQLVFGTLDSFVEYDCAEGMFIGAVVLTPAGDFEVHGTHTPGQGGPERIGINPPSYSAHYRGSISADDTMTLTNDVPELKTRLGPFTLRRDAEPILTRCL